MRNPLILTTLLLATLASPALACDAAAKSAAAAMCPFTKPTLMSIHVKDANVRDLLNQMARKGGINIVMDAAVTGKVSLDLRRVTFAQAFFKVMEADHLVCEEHDNALHIHAVNTQSI